MPLNSSATDRIKTKLPKTIEEAYSDIKRVSEDRKIIKIMVKGQQSKDGGAKSLVKSGLKEGKDVCKICESEVTEQDKGISCDVCEYWLHSKCAKISDSNYKIYKKESLQWVCPTCMKAKKDVNGLYQSMIEMIKSSEEDRENDKEEREMMMTMMKKMSLQISGLEKIIDDKINEKIKLTENEILTKINEEMEERLEKFKRRKNIIVYGVAEREGRNEKERFETDCKNIKDLLTEIKTDIKSYEVTRIGKFNGEGSKIRPRPIRIELSNESDKFEILKNAIRIRNTRNENLKRVVITTDMSFKQRQSEKLLREQMMERRQSGEKNLKIRKGRIV